jgi:hypothetical protein
LFVLHRRLCNAQNELYARGRQSQVVFAVRGPDTERNGRDKPIPGQIDKDQISNSLEVLG